MAEYIEREAAVTVPVLPKEHREYQTFNLDDAYEQGWYDALDNLVNIPAVDVAPVRHGRWINYGDGVCCSVCESERPTKANDHKLSVKEVNFCYYCGAKMDLED